MVKDSIFRHIISSSQHCLILLASSSSSYSKPREPKARSKKAMINWIPWFGSYLVILLINDKLDSFVWIVFGYFTYLFTVKAISVFFSFSFYLSVEDCHCRYIVDIEKLCIQMDKVFRLPWELNLLLPSFRLYSAYTETFDPARRPDIPQQWYWHGTARHWKFRFNLREDTSAPSLFPSCCIIYLCF